MISSIKQFELALEKAFGNINRNSLSGISHGRVRFNLGGDSPNMKERLDQSLLRGKLILQDCLKDKDIWFRITFWNEGEKDNLLDAGLNINQVDLVLEDNIDDNDILVLYKRKFSATFINPIILSNINFEIGNKPFANFTCYFINFSIPVVINIYDDRGMDVVSTSSPFIKNLSQKYKDWITQ